MKCSICVGSLSEERKLYREVRNESDEVVESYYLTEISMNGEIFPAVGSEFILSDIVGKVEIQHYIRTEGGDKDKKMFTFIQVITCEKVNENTPDKNYVEMGGVVARSRGLLPSMRSGMENLPFILRYSSYDKNRNIAHCIAREFNARKLSAIKVGDILEFSGYLKRHKNSFEVVVLEVFLFKQKGKR